MGKAKQPTPPRPDDLPFFSAADTAKAVWVILLFFLWFMGGLQIIDYIYWILF